MCLHSHAAEKGELYPEKALLLVRRGGDGGCTGRKFAVPLGLFFAGQTEITLAFISAAVLFLPLFVFLPKADPAER